MHVDRADADRTGWTVSGEAGSSTTSRSAGGRRVAALVRHGHFDRPEGVASAHLPLPLSERGRRQARAAADTILADCERLGLALDARIEASQLLRSWETARLIADGLRERSGRDFEIEERLELIERGLGSCANLPLIEIERVLAQDPRLEPLPAGWRRIPDFRLPVPGAESLLEAGARTARRIEASVDELSEGEESVPVRVFVGHSGCLRHAAVQLGVLDVAFVSRSTMEHTQVVYLERGPEGRWRRLAGEWEERTPKAGDSSGARADESPASGGRAA